MTSPPHREPRQRAARTLHRRIHGPLPAAQSWRRAAANRALRPATLWPFADAEPLPGTARLAGWLARTIITLVTTYTRPGDRVLLLTPPAGTPGPRRSAHPYSGLTEAVWTITRLGRSTDTATAEPAPADPPNHADATLAESVSGRRLHQPAEHGSADPNTDPVRHHHGSGHRPEGAFALTITAVEPHATDWLARTDWTSLLTQRGLVAVVTHSDLADQRLLDPQPAIVNTLGEHGLRLADHIAVLDAPLPAPAAHPSRPDTGPVRRVHHDLLLFTRPAASEADEQTENPDA
ncbi:hypothetical protein [Amycolatopsis albispora]|uniref:Uncharacterized protein n=1 Tax=Amycolatopsis albispora TaxID=1804986 RepID=A0A344L6J9_9PSEU|nr:hypothetical protein [Amycolatopsis albispora]AXB43673.1 hypothetical protein A4R43_14930 [Amycolatopsis albispora]